jgi:hypothetical protein
MGSIPDGTLEFLLDLIFPVSIQPLTVVPLQALIGLEDG